MIQKSKFYQLAQARANYERAKAALDEQVKAFYDRPEIAELKAALDAAKTELDTVDGHVRMDVLSAYEFQQIKKGDGFEVKITKSVVIPDPARAVDWCLTHFTPALKLDDKIFKQAVKGGTIPPELAQVQDEPKVYLDSDLSRFLDGAS